MAKMYPADHDVFALVCIDYAPARPNDAQLVQMVNDKLQKHSLNKSEFIATAEDVKTLRVVFDLEQMIGREIAWVRGISFDEVIRKRKAIPNSFKRFCTSFLKIEPIKDFVIHSLNEPVLMRQGIRMDESERAKQGWKQIYVDSIEEIGANGKPKRKKIGWAVSDYPMIRDRIYYPTVRDWKQRSGLVFPSNSNCSHCFWKGSAELRQNLETNAAVIEWAAKMEDEMKRQWKSEISMRQVMNLGLQLEMTFGGGASCQSGFCTD
jgi:hypothetical protein